MKAKIIAPASSCTDALSKLSQAVELLQRNGFEVTYSENLFASLPLPYYANEYDLRLQDLRDAITSVDIDVIFCFRGGYGSGEIVEACMDLKDSIKKKKLLIGFSDITAIHLLFNQVFGMPSLHGPVLTTLLGDQKSHMEDIKKILSGEIHSVEIRPRNSAAEWGEKIEGEVVGGNMTVLQTMIGTKLHPVTAGKILFLEDCNEPGYKIARTLNHFERAGIFDNLKALVLGDFTGEDPNKVNAISDFVNKHHDIPIYEISAGHGSVNNPILMGDKKVAISGGYLEYSYDLE